MIEGEAVALAIASKHFVCKNFILLFQNGQVAFPERIRLIGRANNGGQYCREVIPNLKGLVPLNDIEAIRIGEINPFTAEIKIEEEPKHYDWKELYNFMITNEAVKNESEISKNTSKE